MILLGCLSGTLAEDKSCCMIAGTGGFTLSEEDKASLEDKNPQDKKESKDSKISQKTMNQSNKEK